MSTFLERMREREDKEKVALAMLAAIATVLLLFGVWGYNFARGDAISNLASSALSVADQVQQSESANSIGTALELLNSPRQDEGVASATTTDMHTDNQQVNVFATEPSASTTPFEYGEGTGENPADVLY